MDCETNDCRREKRGCKGCFYDDYCHKEITADKMFQELGYEKYEDLEYSTRYVKNTKFKNEGETIRETIEFVLERHFIGVDTFSFRSGTSFRKLLTLKELKAINKKVKELGWM